ncbi:conserved Plasmodium protein, unknown function [Plasmodium knowlesi strain H]|uniref:Endonuclease/exonuclease/phosphatase domain containing protein n=3 Tax=Plasmodium knowlesi TaxID=5850 RepID=A0A5K1V4M6_PLAKH|nr:conserved Plasmodium protein, unknown function [Plasmodium knowlesi strain H]OTN67537.1 Uncharacterized protein PKNOH_S06405200 [Plasmodium knowlesi]CAA9987327.1 conserved Plasmodium protein, unknown function [Plasmodium knowlesi strain H]SBO23392.1 conserved Plasmodium protein, unknown function [Plasmodium knowlesi strain H]SBO24639.1 conserved Plasmodium protein, unknown function [Plasmodium knowlesi strain H]VVS76801.1 conserved Plasmodium protein, unknown function [Plasmodium knowlesi s|eukprot:XP_002258331.1 hypothetical protein, conserved in Plasmodium species [Plasmodium knowlesi strain H]
MKVCVRKHSPCTYDHTRKGNPKRGGEITSATATRGKASLFSLCPQNGLKKKSLFDLALEDSLPLGVRNRQHLRLEQGTHPSVEQLLRLVLLEWLIERLIEKLIGGLVLHALSEVKNRMTNFLLHCIKMYMLCLSKLLDFTSTPDIRTLGYDDNKGIIVHPTIHEVPHSYKKKVNNEEYTSGTCSLVRSNKIIEGRQKKYKLLVQEKNHSSRLIFSQQSKIREREKINLSLHLFIERNEDLILENSSTVLCAFLKKNVISSSRRNVQNRYPRLYIHRMMQNEFHFIYRAKGIGLFIKEFPSLRGMLHIIITYKRKYPVSYLIEEEIIFVCCILNTSLAQVNGSISLFFEVYPRFANAYTIRPSYCTCSYLAHRCEAGLSVFSSMLCSLCGDIEICKDPSSVGTDKEKNEYHEKNERVNNLHRAGERDKRDRTQIPFTKSSINHCGGELQVEYPKHSDKTHKVDIKERRKKKRVAVSKLVEKTSGREKSSSNRSEDERCMTQNRDMRKGPRCACGNDEGVDQYEENEKENDKDNDNKEETNKRKSENRNINNHRDSNNGDRHNSEDNSNNGSDGDEEENDDGEDDEVDDDEDDAEEEDEDGDRNDGGEKRGTDPSTVIAEQRGEPNNEDDTCDACEKAKGKEIKSKADNVKNCATDIQSDSNEGNKKGNNEEDEESNTLDCHNIAREDRTNINVDGSSAQRSSVPDRVKKEENQNSINRNMKKNINEEESNSGGGRSGGRGAHINRNCKSGDVGIDQPTEQPAEQPTEQPTVETGKNEKDEKNLRIMNKMLKNLSFMSFNTGLLEYKIFGLCIYQNPPFISKRLLHIPYALKETNADIIALQEVYDEKHVEYLKKQLMAKYPFCARDNYCSDVFKEKFGDVNVEREDEFDEGNRQDGRDGPSNRTAKGNSYENGKRTGTSANNPNGGNKKEPRCTKKKYFALHHGLLVFSKYPIIYSFFHGFKHVTYLEYLFGTKGFLEVVIDVPFFSYITLVNMHLASGAADTESKYIERVRDFEIKQIMEIARNAEKRNTIPIIIGDLNAAPNLCPNNYSSFIKRGWKDAWLYARNVKKKKTKQLIAKALPRLHKKKPRTISSNSCHSFGHLFPRVGSSTRDLVKTESKKEAKTEAKTETKKAEGKEQVEEREEEREENHPIHNNQEGVKNKDYAYSNHSLNLQKSIYIERPQLYNKMDTINDELGSRSSLRVCSTFNCSENNGSIVYSNSMKTISGFSKNLESYGSIYYSKGYTREKKKWNVDDNSVEVHPSVCLSNLNLENHGNQMDKMNDAINKHMQLTNVLQRKYFGCVSHEMTEHSRSCAVTIVPSKRLQIFSRKVAKTVSKTIWRRKGNFLPANYKRVKYHHRKGRTRALHQKEHFLHLNQIISSGKKHTLNGVGNWNPLQRGDILHCSIIPNSSTPGWKYNPSDVVPEKKRGIHIPTVEMHYRQISSISSGGDDVLGHQEGDHDMLESTVHVNKAQDDRFNHPTEQTCSLKCYADKRVKEDKKERQRNIQSCSTCDVFKKEDKMDNITITPKCTLRTKGDGEKLNTLMEEDGSEYHAATNIHHHYNSDQNLFSSDISSESNHSYTDLYDDEEEANWFSDRSSNASRNDLQERNEVRVPVEMHPCGVVNCMAEEGFTNREIMDKVPETETMKEFHTSGCNQLTDKKCTKREDKIMTHCVPPLEMEEKGREDESTPLIHAEDTIPVRMSKEKGDGTSNHTQMHREKDSKVSDTITFYKNQLNDHKEKVRNVDEQCPNQLSTQNPFSAFLKEELTAMGQTQEEDSVLSEMGTRRDDNENCCNGQVENLPCTGTYPSEENANINTNEKKKKISKLAKKIKQMKKKIFYNILRNYERHHDGGVERRTLLKGNKGESKKKKQETEEGNSFILENVKRKNKKKHHLIHSLKEGEHTEKETNCKGEATPGVNHSPRSDESNSLENQLTNTKGKNDSDKFLHFTKKCYNSRTEEALKKNIFYFIKKLKFKTANKLKQKFCTCAKNVKGNLGEEKKLLLMEKEQKGESQPLHRTCPFVQNNSNPPRSFSSIKLPEDFIKMCDCSPLSKKERNQRSKNYNRGKAPSREGQENYSKSKKYFIFKRRQKEEKDKYHLMENINEGRISLGNHNCVNANLNSSKNKKCTHECSSVRGGESNQGQLHNKMKFSIKNKNFFKFRNEENISSDEFTWDPLNPLNVIGPHSRCNGLRCDYIFFPPISYNRGRGAKGGKNGTAEKEKIGQKGKLSEAEKTDEAYKIGAVKSQPSVHITEMPDDEQLVMDQEKAPKRSNSFTDPVGDNCQNQDFPNFVLNTQNNVFTDTRNERDRKDHDHQAKGKRYEETLNLKKSNDLKILKHYYIKSAKILFNEPSVMVHTNRNQKNSNCCYSFCMKIKNVHFVTMSDHYAIKIDLRLKKNHKFGRND